MSKIINLRTEWLYAVMMTFFGVLLVFLTPPLQVPDEPNHFFRVYQISEGIFRSPAKEYPDVNDSKIYFYAEIPKSLSYLFSSGVKEHNIVDGKNYYSLQSIDELFSVPIDSTAVEEFQIPNTGFYSPLVYAPQVLFTFLAKLIFGTVGAVFYGSRLGAIIFTTVCVFWAIRLLPEKKFLIFVIAFMPMFLFEVASCSADAVIFAVSILSSAYLLSLAKTSAPISAREIFFIAVVAISLGLINPFYGTILALYFLIPSPRFGRKLTKYLGGILLLAVFLISASSWIHFSKSDLPVSLYAAPFEGVNVTAQTEFVKNNPLHFFSAVFETIKTPNFDYYFESFVGILGWLTIRLPNVFYFLYSIVLMIAASVGSLNLRKSQRAFMVAATLITFFVTFLYSYVTWTPIGSDNVLGFQGRYLIPVVFMFLAAFSNFKNQTYEKKFAFIAGFTSASVTVWEIFKNFY